MTNELSYNQAAIVKALLPDHKIQDIASLFGVNQRAVSQIKSGYCYPTVKPNYDHGLRATEITTPKINVIEELRHLKAKSL